MAKNNINVMPQPPYSLDMAPCDLFLFPKLKKTLKGQRFSTIDEIKTKSQNELKTIPILAIQQCFSNWKLRWHKCVISKGDYFEGDEKYINE